MTDLTFAERLKAVIGAEKPTRWATDRGISGATMSEWLNGGAIPYPKTMAKLEAGTGIPKEWWLHGDLPPPKPSGLPGLKKRAGLFPPASSGEHPAPDRALMMHATGGGKTAAGVGNSTDGQAYLLAAELHTERDYSLIHRALIENCLRACHEVHGEEFKAMTALDQLAYAVDLYNLIVRMSSLAGKSPKDALHLEVIGLSEQLRLFIKMGWAMQFPSPLSKSIPPMF